MKLRDYQTRAIDEVEVKHRTQQNVVLVMPMASGKTFTAAHYARRHLAATKRRKVLWVAHTHELVAQAAGVLADVCGEAVGVMLPDVPADKDARVQVTSIQTLLQRPEMHGDATLVVTDEAHHYLAAQWNLVMGHAKGAKILGLTATPQRQDGKPLGDMFSDIVTGVQYSELLKSRLIVPVQVYAPATVLADRYARDPVDAWREYGQDSQTFAYCVTTVEANRLSKSFDDQGIRSAIITQETPQAERRDTMERFRAREVRVIVNVYILTEGVDVPDARCCLLMRPFAFAGNYLQACGRILRAAPGKRDGILIDLSGSYNRGTHGSPCADRDYSLDGDEPIRKKGDGEGGGGSGPRAPKGFGDEQLYLAERGALGPDEQPAPPLPSTRRIARGSERAAIRLAARRYKNAGKGIAKHVGGM